MSLKIIAAFGDPFKAGLIYLAVPAALFFATWLQPVLAVLAVLTFAKVLGSAVYSLPYTQWPRRWYVLFYLVFAVVLAVTSGTSPIINGTPFLDLAKHRWIFHDLTVNAWPVILDEGVLRYAIGFYLVPSAVAKMLPIVGYWAAIAWLSLGVFLVFCAIDRIADHPVIAPISVVVFAFFSGLDIVYFAVTQPDVLGHVVMLEAWARDHLLLIGSNPFNLSWTPQHAMAAWIGGILLFRMRGTEWPTANAGSLVTVVAFWSPFCAIAVVLVLFPLALCRPDVAFNKMNWLSLVPALSLIAYLTAGDAGTQFRMMPPSTDFVITYVWFVALEFGILSILLVAANGFRYWIVAPTVLLMALPFFIVGTHDLQMRASVVGITILFLAAVTTAVERGLVMKVVLAAVAAIGVWAGATEYVRVLRAPVYGKLEASIASMPGEIAPQYLTHEIHYLIGRGREGVPR